jgi:hypothetical protein
MLWLSVSGWPRSAMSGLPSMAAATHAAALLLPSSFSTVIAQPDHVVQCSTRPPHPPARVLLNAHVASVCVKYFRYFRGMFQVFDMDVAKVDWGRCCICCKWLYTYVVSVYSKYFICFFRRMLQACLFGCCICFTHMLQLFYLEAVYVLQWLFKCFQVFLQVFQTHVSSVSSAFICMLQIFHFNVSK